METATNNTITLPQASNKPLFQLTERAVAKIKDFGQSIEGAAGKSFRVAIRAGGCSGYSYDFLFDDKRDEDYEIVTGDVKVVVDPQSMRFLKGSTVDFVDGFQSSGFTVKNPNATGGCGCGSSFSV